MGKKNDDIETVENEQVEILDEKDEAIKELQSSIEQMTMEIDRLKRGAADVVNRNKQLEVDKKYASTSLIRNLLIPISYFEGALKMQTDDEVFKNFLKGFEMIYNLLLEQLYNSGLKEIDVKVDSPFDPKVHEVFEIVPSEDEEDVVVEVVQKGYYFKDRVLIPAKVKITGHVNMTEEETAEEKETVTVN